MTQLADGGSAQSSGLAPHTHPDSPTVAQLQQDVGGKAPLVHTHTASQVSGLPPSGSIAAAGFHLAGGASLVVDRWSNPIALNGMCLFARDAVVLDMTGRLSGTSTLVVGDTTSTNYKVLTLEPPDVWGSGGSLIILSDPFFATGASGVYLSIPFVIDSHAETGVIGVNRIGRYRLDIIAPAGVATTTALWINDDSGRNDGGTASPTLLTNATAPKLHTIDLVFDWLDGWRIDSVLSRPYRPPWTDISGTTPAPAIACSSFRGTTVTQIQDTVNNLNMLSARQRAMANAYNLHYYVGGHTQWTPGICSNQSGAGYSGIYLVDSNGNGARTFWGYLDTPLATLTALTPTQLATSNTTQMIAPHEFSHMLDKYLPVYNGDAVPQMLSNSTTWQSIWSSYVSTNGHYSGTDLKEGFAEAGAAYIWYKTYADAKFLNYIFNSNAGAINQYITWMDGLHAWS